LLGDASTGIWAGRRATTPNGSLPVGGALRHKSAPKTRQPQNWASHLTTLTYRTERAPQRQDRGGCP